MTPGVTGGAADEVRHLVPDVETLAQRLGTVDYLVDEGLATSMFLALRLPQPLLLEGEAGVGKTEAANALAALPADGTTSFFMPYCRAMVTAAQRPRALNDPVGFSPSSFI